MCRRKGTLSIILILLFSALLSASTALVLFLTRGSAAAVSHEEGLRSVYAAESGANWALSRLSSGAGGSTALTLEEGDQTILVRITDDGESGRIKVCSENEKEIESLKEHREHLTKRLISLRKRWMESAF